MSGCSFAKGAPGVKHAAWSDELACCTGEKDVTSHIGIQVWAAGLHDREGEFQHSAGGLAGVEIAVGQALLVESLACNIVASLLAGQILATDLQRHFSVAVVQTIAV